MPDEGYVTIINDVSLARIIVSKDNKLALISPGYAYGKVNKTFAYSVDLIGDTSKVASVVVSPRSGQPTLQSIGLALNGTDVVGTPTVAGSSSYDVLVKDSAGATLLSSTVQVIIVPEATPSLTAATINATVGVMFNYEIPAVAVGAIGTTSPAVLPAGISFYGPVGVGTDSKFVLSGTPRVAGTTSIDITVTDAFGDSSTQTFTLVVA
jgi:hypothetical protein